LLDAVVLGAAAGALNVTRRGLATGVREQIEQLTRLVAVEDVVDGVTAVSEWDPGRRPLRSIRRE
jgi:hypothetical protein